MPNPSIKDEKLYRDLRKQSTPMRRPRAFPTLPRRARFTRNAPKSLECTVIRAGPKTELISVPEAALQSGRPW
jgi:hypothetical protein